MSWYRPFSSKTAVQIGTLIGTIAAVAGLAALSACAPAPSAKNEFFQSTNQTGLKTADGRAFTGAGQAAELETLKSSPDVSGTDEQDRALAARILIASIDRSNKEFLRVALSLRDSGRIFFDFSNKALKTGSDRVFEPQIGKSPSNDPAAFELSLQCEAGTTDKASLPACTIATLSLKEKRGSGGRAGLIIRTQQSSVIARSTRNSVTLPALKRLLDTFSTAQPRTLQTFEVAWGPSGFDLQLRDQELCPAGRLVETNELDEPLRINCPGVASSGISGRMLGNTTRGEVLLELNGTRHNLILANEEERVYIVVQKLKPAAAPNPSSNPEVTAGTGALNPAGTVSLGDVINVEYDDGAPPAAESQAESQVETTAPQAAAASNTAPIAAPNGPPTAPAQPAKQSPAAKTLAPTPVRAAAQPAPRAQPLSPAQPMPPAQPAAPARPAQIQVIVPPKTGAGWLIPLDLNHPATKGWNGDRANPVIDRAVKNLLAKGPLRKFALNFLPNRDLVIGAIKSQGAPSETAMLTLRESNFFTGDGYPIQVGSRGEVGPWQFMASTAKSPLLQLGFKPLLSGPNNKARKSDPCDPRADLALSSRAAGRYVAYLLKMFPRDPKLAILSYNWGEGNTDRAMDQLAATPLPARLAEIKNIGLTYWAVRKFNMAPPDPIQYVENFVAAHHAMLEMEPVRPDPSILPWKAPAECTR